MTITQLIFGGNLSLSSLLILLIFLILPIISSTSEHDDHHDHEDLDVVLPRLSSSNNNNSNSKSIHNNVDIDFIRSRCGETLYPDLCYNSLCGYAYAVQKDPAVLTRIAIGLTLFRATRLLRYAANLSSSSSGSSYGALEDCISVIGDAVEQIRGSLKQMRRLMMMMNQEDAMSLRIGLSDVQTWMSAALTNEDTCTEGLDQGNNNNNNNNNCNWEEELAYRATKVKRLTSNALALLNGYVANLSSSISSSSPPPPPPPTN